MQCLQNDRIPKLPGNPAAAAVVVKSTESVTSTPASPFHQDDSEQLEGDLASRSAVTTFAAQELAASENKNYELYL